MEKRTRDTYRLIQDTYIALMGETPYDRIKIREIAEAAHIQRSTFYQYYDNLNALISALEAELLGEMVFYKETEFDINHIEPLQSVRDWFAWGMDRRDYLLALMGENGDPYFEEKFKKKVCMDINRMMDAEGMPRDDLRPFCVELNYSIHASLLKFAMQLGVERCPFSTEELTRLANYWRVCALKAEQERKFPVSGKNKKSPECG